MIDRSQPLTEFFTSSQKDGRIGTVHIGLYTALHQYRIDQGFINPIEAFGQDIMRIAKISASSTYHKCINELNEYGYIKYMPSFKRNQGSRIYFPEHFSQNNINEVCDE